jgi:diacylglycerol kinase family enzyme
MPRRAVLVVNPMASAVTEDRIARVARELGTDNVLRTEEREHGIELVRAASRDWDAIVVFSGDGGFNEALNGLDRDIPIGFLPGGGTNVLSRALGLPRNPVRAAAQVSDALAAGRTRRISVGRVNGRRFGFSAGVGFDAELTRRVDQLGRTHDGRRPGDVAFAVQAVRALRAGRGRPDPVLELDGDARAAAVLVANCDPYTYFGPIGLHVAPEARFELGLDVVAPLSAHPRVVPRFLAYALFGRGQERAPDVVYRHDVDGLTVRSQTPMPVHADGEDLGDLDEVAFEAERDAVSVLA